MNGLGKLVSIATLILAGFISYQGVIAAQSQHRQIERFTSLNKETSARDFVMAETRFSQPIVSYWEEQIFALEKTILALHPTSNRLNNCIDG